MITPPKFTDEQRAQLHASMARVAASFREFAEALNRAVSAASRAVEAARTASPDDFALAPPQPAPDEPYDECRCTNTNAGLDFCPRCPGNTTKEPRP